MAGTLDTTTVRKFDLAVDGNCKVGGGNIGLDVIPGEKRPDLFTAENGVIKFADPQKFGTFVMPRGHEATVTISLANVRDKESEKTGTLAEGAKRAPNYLCLGIRRKGKPTKIIYKIDDNDEVNSVTSINLRSTEEFELIPMVSTSDLSAECAAVEQKIDVPEGFITGDAIDFSAVYRINLSMKRLENVIWEETDYIFDGGKKMAGGLQNVSIGPINGKTQFFASFRDSVGISADQFGMSEDGVNWNKLDCVLTNPTSSTTDVQITTSAYGNGQWWGGYTHESGVFFSTDAIRWRLVSGQNPELSSSIMCIAFGDENDRTFMMVARDGTVYTLPENERTWQECKVQEHFSSSYAPKIFYGAGRWMVAISKSILAYDNIGDEESGWRIDPPNADLHCNGGCYAHGRFYVRFSNQIWSYKFPGESGWRLEGELSSEFDCENNASSNRIINRISIAYFEPTDKLYIFTANGKVAIGIFFND